MNRNPLKVNRKRRVNRRRENYGKIWGISQNPRKAEQPGLKKSELRVERGEIN